MGVVFFVIFQVLGRHQSAQQSKHRMLGRDVSVALYGSGMISLGFAFLWLAVLKVAAQILIKAAILVSLAVTFGVAVFTFAKGGDPWWPRIASSRGSRSHVWQVCMGPSGPCCCH